MDWPALLLSLRLATFTVVLLLPLGLVVARVLAWTPFPGRRLAEAALALPLVLPPTVLGLYLLLAFGQGSPLGRAFEALTGQTLAFSFSGLLLASIVFNLPFAIQPMQRAFESIPARRARRGRVLRDEPLEDLHADRAAAGLARRADGGGAHLRAHAGRVRRRADGRRQHPRRDADHRHRDLRPRAGVRPHRRQRDGGGAAVAVAGGHRHRVRDGAAGTSGDERRRTVGAPDPARADPARRRARLRAGRAAGAHRSLGQRQVDGAAGDRRAGAPPRRTDRLRRRRLVRPRRGRAAHAAAALGRAGVPALRAVSAPVRAAQRDRGAGAPGPGRPRGAGARAAGAGAPARPRGPAAGGAVRRPAAARRGGARARPRPRRCCCSTSRSRRSTG